MAEVKLLSGQALATAIRELFNSKGALRCAVAFWGPEMAALAARRSAKVVLDVAMKGTSQNAMKALGVPNKTNVRVLDYLHSKLYIGEDHAILASANASHNAIGSGINPPLLREAGILIDRIEKPGLYRELEQLFGQYWDESRVATQDDLERAVKTSRILAARDQVTGNNDFSSVLDAVLANPDGFERTAFVFADVQLREPDKASATAAYDETLAMLDGAHNHRQLICTNCDGDEDRVLSEVSYIIMYWFGPGSGIYAYHDIVRVKTSDGSIAFFGNRQWSTVRRQIGLAERLRIIDFWQADRERAQALANLEGGSPGERFVVRRHDDLFSKLEAGG
jgi:hypothetical protein